MSYTTIYRVPIKGEIESYAEFGNSWASAPYIWTVLSTHYLGWQEGECISAREGKLKQLWDLHRDPRLSISERIVLTITFDNVMVKKDSLNGVAYALDEFTRRWSEYKSTLPAQAVALRQLVADPTCYAACWTQTSVDADSWLVYLKNGKTRFYALDRDRGPRKRHWFLNIKDLQPES